MGGPNDELASPRNGGVVSAAGQDAAATKQSFIPAAQKVLCAALSANMIWRFSSLCMRFKRVGNFNSSPSQKSILGPEPLSIRSVSQSEEVCRDLLRRQSYNTVQRDEVLQGYKRKWKRVNCTPWTGRAAHIQCLAGAGWPVMRKRVMQCQCDQCFESSENNASATRFCCEL